jgi:hypothetical protein
LSKSDDSKGSAGRDITSQANLCWGSQSQTFPDQSGLLLGIPQVLFQALSITITGSDFFDKPQNCYNWLSISLVQYFRHVLYATLERISKMRLSPHGGVAGRLKMLTYYRVCSAFSPPRAPDGKLGI